MSITEQQATGTFAADPVHSHVGFEVPYAVATFSGEVTDFSATLVDGHLDGSAKIESITLKDENLQAHVLSPSSSTPSAIPFSRSTATCAATATARRSRARSR